MDLVSASQINLYRECPRKWAHRYIAGLKTPQHPAAALGTEVDDTQLQPYLRDDRPLDFTRESGYIAAAGLAFLPKPRTHGLEVQKHFVIPSPTDERFGFQGYIVLWMPQGGMPDIGTDNPTVADFKTTGNFKWMKHAADLAVDVQAQLYATWAMYSTKARVVDLVWIYFATKGPRKAKRTHLRVLGNDVADQFMAINETAVEMYGVRSSCTNPLDLEPNTSMCEAYGGCPYRANCNLSPGEIIDSIAAKHSRTETLMAEVTNGTGVGLLARLKAQKAGGAPVEAIGINPPESKLPPAPPVGTHVYTGPVEVAPAPVSNPPASTLVEPIQPGLAKTRGRPKKDTAAADAEVHSDLSARIKASGVLKQFGHEVKLTLPVVDPVLSAEESEKVIHSLTALTVTVTWAEETFTPVSYNTIKVGPFEATAYVRDGETIAQAHARVYAELVKFAESVRESKVSSFTDALTAMGVSK